MDIFISAAFEADYQAAPITLLDIGASGGVQAHWKEAQNHLQVVGFEPDPREFQNLVTKAPAGVTYLNTALADKPGPVTFRLARRQMVSSIFEPNTELVSRFPDFADYDIVRTVEVEADTLDNALKNNNIEDVDFAKIDTQGAELSILQGAKNTVRDCIFGLEIEVEFIPIYKGQPLFAEVEQYVRDHGFELFDLRPFYWKRKGGQNLGGPYGQIAFADALFFKSLSGLSAMLAKLENDEMRRRKVLRAVSVSLLYGYVDYAVELFNLQGDLFSAQEQREFEFETKKTERLLNRLPDFRGRWRVANLLDRASEAIDPSNAGWSIGLKRLGNR